MGAEREIVEGLSMSLNLVYRRYINMLENFQTNRVYIPSGYVEDATGPRRDGRNSVYSNLDNAENAVRDYRGVSLGFRKREGRLRIQGAYTWSQLIGNILDSKLSFQPLSSLGNNPGRDVFLYGYLPDDARHSIRLGLVYAWSRWLNTGATYTFVSGRPYSRLYRNDVDGGFTDYRAAIGVNPGSNVNDPSDDRPTRLPDLSLFNLSARLNLLPLLNVNASVFVDVLNLLAMRTTTSVTQEDAGAYGAQKSRLGPTTARLGAEIRF